MLKDFRTFIARGNVLDLAVGVIIGGAFATITKSLTDDIIMPVVGAIFGGFNFSSYFVRLGPVPATEDGWWLLRARTRYARHGSSSQDMAIWSADGAPVAQQMQSVAIFG